MDLVLKEKFAICYTCCGPTYRESAYKQIKESYFDNDDLYFCVLTDDKEYFKGLERKNLIVNELKDFYDEFPVLEKNEYFLEGDSKTDYATKFVGGNYLFPFSTIRFNILQAIKLGIKNVAFLCTDTHIDFTKFSNDIFDKPNNFYNAVSEWDSNSSEHGMDLIVKILKEDFNLDVDETVRVLDAAARMYIPDTLESLIAFFNTWNTVIEKLYETGDIKRFRGHYVINDEYILAPIYNVLNLSKKEVHSGNGFFVVNHAPDQERFWRLGGANGLLEHHDYEEFLKINNL